MSTNAADIEEAVASAVKDLDTNALLADTDTEPDFLLPKDDDSEVDDTGKDDDTGKTSGTDDASGAASEDASSNEDDDDTEDVPTEYFGRDLSMFEPDVRKAIIEMVEPRDKHIQSLMRGRAAEAAKAAEAGAPADEKPAVDEAELDREILESLNLRDADLDDPNVQALLGVSRFALELKDRVEAVEGRTVAAETDAYWRKGLKSLEEEFGALPAEVSVEDIMQASATAGISEPTDAYWRIMGPLLNTLDTEARRARDKAVKDLKRKGTTARTKSTAKTTGLGLKAKDTAGGVREAFERLTAEGRIDLSGSDD